MSIDFGKHPCGVPHIVPPRFTQGFTLTELLVGVAVGLIGIVAMFQVLSVWDKMKRSTAAGSDAQIAGTVGFFRMERDIKLAGMGFGAAKSGVMGCNVTAVVHETNSGATRVTNTRSAFQIPLVPVKITRTTDKPDKLTVFYGNSSYFAAEQAFKASTSTSKKAESRHGFKVNDAVVVANDATSATSCELIEVSGDSNADNLTLDHAANSLRYNGAGSSGFSTGVLFNLGPRPQLNTWEVFNNELVGGVRITALTVTDGLGLNTMATVADGIIDLQARYGIDNGSPNPTYKVGKWLTVAEGDPANWTRLLAVRVAILARSQQYEPTKPGPTYVTPVAPNWLDGDGNSVDFLMTNVDGSADTNPQNDNDWRNYRYRVYSATIPLRNIVWGVSP